MTANGYTGAEVSITDVTGLSAALADVPVLPIAQSDVTGLEAELAAKLEGPLSTADISDLAAALALKLNAAGGEVVNSTFIIRKEGWTSALRFRSTGDAVDIDKTNGDVVISSFLGTVEDVFDPPQTGLMRLRSDGVTLSGGLIEFGDTVYGGQQWVNTANGTANLAGAELRPSDHNLAGWTFNPKMVQAGTILPTAGVSHIVRIRAMGTTITNILLHLTAGGATLTPGQCFAQLLTDAGTVLSSTADQATAWASGGLKTMPLTVPQAVTRGGWYKVRLWFNGTTGPTLSRAVNSSSAIVNVGLATPNFLYATADTGLTTLASAPAGIGTQTGGSTAWWVGLS